MTTKELSQLYYLNREIEQQRRRLIELETAATNCSQVISGMPHSGNVSDKVSNYAVEIAELKEMVNLNMQKCWHELNRLNRYINSIEDSLIRQILTLRYINGLSWLQMAHAIGYNSADGLRMLHNRYLKKN